MVVVCWRTNSRLVFGRLEMVDKLQADGCCRLRSLVFLEDQMISLDGRWESPSVRVLDGRSQW